MKRLYFLTVLLLTCVLTISAKRVTPYSGSRILWDMRSQQTLFNDGWYARMIQLNNGRLLAASESNWNIIISYSDDMGHTWSPQQTIFTPPAGLRYFDVDLCQLSDGKIIITYNTGFPDHTILPDGRWGVRLRISEDNGATWTDDIFVYDGETTFDNGTWEPNILELPSGELHLYVSDEAPYTHSGEQCIQLFRSADKGYTWTGPQSISFRPGARDGMPTAILLSDSIVVAIEDNGWPGADSFVPVTVRTPIANCWSDGPVGASSPMRSLMITPGWSPRAFGGAPYLRKLKSGETILSRQSYHESGDYGLMNCFVYVGDSTARNFKAMSQPFPDNLHSRISVEVNSISVVGDSMVYAIGGFGQGPHGRHADIVRGFPVRALHACRATPRIDGLINADEYHTPSADQVKMGTNTLSSNIYADFSYDKRNLYFVISVDCDSLHPCANDSITLLIDADNVSDDTPVDGMYELTFTPGGNPTTRRGHNGVWLPHTPSSPIKCATSVNNGHYIIETAIPWRALGKKSAPRRHPMAVGLAVSRPTPSSPAPLTETLPDLLPDQSWTWFPLHLSAPE